MPKAIGTLKGLGGVYDNMYEQSGRVYDVSEIAPTLHTNGGGNQETKVLIPNEARVRKLTPLECWRLMGYSDNDFNSARNALIQNHYGGKDKANSQLYKQAGNSIVVDVLEYLLLSLLIPDNDSKTKDLSKWLDELLGV